MLNIKLTRTLNHMTEERSMISGSSQGLRLVFVRKVSMSSVVFSSVKEETPLSASRKTNAKSTIRNEVEKSDQKEFSVVIVFVS